MPDTPANQAESPQSSSQKTGVGFPAARVCAIVSLATACALSAQIGPNSGKQTGETALLRQQRKLFDAGGIAVSDRDDCPLLMLALQWNRGVQVCTRQHQQRRTDFRRGQRLGKHDHLVVWTKPQRPTWMDEATCATIPAPLTLGEIRFSITVANSRRRAATATTRATSTRCWA